jgi:hypothetical protein
MFKIVQNPEFTHTVPVMVPVDGGHVEQSLKCRFRVLPADEIDSHDLATPAGTEAYLRAICVRFEDVCGDDGQPIPPSDALTDQLLGITFVRIALVRAYTEAMAKAKRGN